MNNNVENSVEETFDEMLDSVKSINDDFINSYFENDNLDQIIEESKEKEEFYDESSLKELSNHLNDELFENEETVEKPVENFSLDDSLNLESSDLENKESEKNDKEELFKTNSLETEVGNSIHVEQTNEIEESEVEEEVKLEKLSDDEIIHLIDKTDSSEEFFNMLEGKMDD